MEVFSVENLQAPSHTLLLKQRARRIPIKITHRGFSRNKSIKCKFFDNSKPQLLQICYEVRHTASTRCHRFDSDFQQKNHDVSLLDPTGGVMKETPWIFDTGATRHVTNDLTNLKLKKPFFSEGKVIVGNGNTLSISHIGIASIDSAKRPLILKRVFYIPETIINVISIQRLCQDNNIYMEFYPSQYVVKDQNTHEVLLQGETDRGLYLVMVANGYGNVPSLSAKISSL